MENKDKIPTIRYYWRSSRRGRGQVLAYSNERGKRTYGGITGCYVTTDEWAQLNSDGSLKNPNSASAEVKAISSMLEDLRVRAISILLDMEAHVYDGRYFGMTFKQVMQRALSEYLRGQGVRKVEISSILSRIEQATANESEKGEV